MVERIGLGRGHSARVLATCRGPHRKNCSIWRAAHFADPQTLTSPVPPVPCPSPKCRSGIVLASRSHTPDRNPSLSSADRGTVDVHRHRKRRRRPPRDRRPPLLVSPRRLSRLFSWSLTRLRAIRIGGADHRYAEARRPCRPLWACSSPVAGLAYPSRGPNGFDRFDDRRRNRP